MEKNSVTKETLYLVDSDPRPRRWVDLALASLVQIWTFTRPFRCETSFIWKVYLVRIGSAMIPMSATDSGYLWRKVVDHWEFRNRLHTNSALEITAEAWSTDGKRLLNEDLVISGSRVTFKKEAQTLGELLKENLIGGCTKEFLGEGMKEEEEWDDGTEGTFDNYDSQQKSRG